MAKYQRNTGGNQSAANTVPAPAVAVPFYKKEGFGTKAIMTGLGLVGGVFLYKVALLIVVGAGGSGWIAKLVALPLSFVFISFVSFGAKLLTDSKEAAYLWFALLTALIAFVVSGLIWDGLPKPSLGSVQSSAPVIFAWKAEITQGEFASTPTFRQNKQLSLLVNGGQVDLRVNSGYITYPPGQYAVTTYPGQPLVFRGAEDTKIILNLQEF